MASNRVTWSGKCEFLLTCVGFAVGVGNIVRFPYLCFQNGGGAFLIPYLLTLLLCGLPMTYLEFSMGQYVGVSAFQFWDICPLLKGLGITSIILNMVIATYYVYILMLALHYFIASFSAELPWKSCDHSWNTVKCFNYGNNSNNFTEQIKHNNTLSYGKDDFVRNYTILENNRRISAAEEYLNNNVLSMGSGLTDLGNVQWQLWLGLLASWLIIYLITLRGIQSSGKVVYITGTLPYVILTIFVIRGVTLPGSLQGIAYYIIPEWNRLKDPKVWFSAAQQIFVSLGLGFGCFITMASYNKLHNNCFRDAVVTTIINSATSLYAGFAVFSVIGFMAHEANLDIVDVIQSGPGLAFIVYPRAIATMPISQMWSALFFLMLIILATSSQAVHFETIVSCFTDQFPSLRKPLKRAALAGIIVILMVIIGTLFTSQAGMYIFTFADWYGTAIGLMVSGALECIILSWIYGANNICSNIEVMTGYKNKWINLYFHTCWKYVSPAFVALILIASVATWSAVTYGDYIYPAWTTAVGWCLALSSLLPIPVTAAIKIYTSTGTSLKNKMKSLTKVSTKLSENIKMRTMKFDVSYCSNEDMKTEMNSLYVKEGI